MKITWKWLITKAALGAITINALTLGISPVGYTLNLDPGFGSGEERLQINRAAKPAWGMSSPTFPDPDLIFNRVIDRESDTYLAIELSPIAEPIGGAVGGIAGSRLGPSGVIVGEEAGRKVGHHVGRGLSKLHHRNRGFFKHF